MSVTYNYNLYFGQKNPMFVEIEHKNTTPIRSSAQSDCHFRNQRRR